MKKAWEVHISVEKGKRKILSLNDVRKSYKNNEVLKGLSFDIYEGDIYGFIGPNGAGKTTTIKLITGLTTLSDGEIQVSKDKDFLIGLVLDQNCLYSNLSAKDNLSFYLRMTGDNSEKTIDYYLDLVGLSEVKNVLVGRFSKGMKRRLVLARTLAINPNLLILDEPLDGLDVASQTIMINLLKEWVTKGNRSILYTSHDMTEVENICNRIGFIRDGKMLLEKETKSLLKYNMDYLRVVPREGETALSDWLNNRNLAYEKYDDEFRLKVKEEDTDAVLDYLYREGVSLSEFNKVYSKLADLYVRIYADEKDN